MYELEYHCELTMAGVISAKTYSNILMTLLTLLVVEHGAGLRLTFPDISGDVITAAENSEIRIRFGVADLDGVTDPFFIGLDISNDSSGATKIQLLCLITYNTSAMSYIKDERRNCSVPPGADTVVFTRTVSRGDDKATLIWKLEQHGVEKRLRLNVTYPPTITSLTFDNDSNQTKTIPSGGKLQLSCSWSNGNPPTAVRLLNNKGQLLTENNNSNNTSLTYELNPVTCNLTGVFTCQTAGAEVNRSVTVLVQCPPVFSATEDVKESFTAGEPVTLSFHVVSHTSDITQCRLRQLSSDMHSAHDVYRLNTTFTCSLTGQPPDLKLSVVMFNVSDSEEGEWHLELSNDSGNTSTRFSLHTEKKPGDESSSSADKVYIMVAVGCFLLLCVAIIVVFLLRRAKHKADTTLRHNVDSNKKKPLKPVLSEDMIINEVYESAGDYPMSYTTLGNESTELSGNSEGEYVYAHTAKIVTWKEQNPSNTAAGNSGEGDNVYAKVQKGDRNTPSNKGDNLYAEVQKGDKNTPFGKEDNSTAKDHLTGDTECAYMSVDVPGAVGKEAKGGDDHAS